MNVPEEPLYVELSDPEQPFVINVDRKGYYRQNHDQKGWEKIAKQLKEDHKVYSVPTRNGIISDAFAAALIDKVPYETVFDLLGYLKDEEEYLPWDEALHGFFNVLQYLGHGPEAEPARKYMLNLMKPLYEKCDFDTISKDYTNDDKFSDL
ncbi:hypothetical protein OESDEN_08877 [Oesophagostomum dentatum]|uniref:ERAP1-like C-terminal domain-containing protein n=1 Tax=Oesophagostomum dentatum TaxID=61180 RepID=A0A0B1T552_OESDE|nr:hypothetical protein OESDEN_08877 [Oesophagostomum dentatum]